MHSLFCPQPLANISNAIRACDRLQVKLQPWSSTEQGWQQLLYLIKQQNNCRRLGRAKTSAQSLCMVAAATAHADDRAVLLAASWQLVLSHQRSVSRSVKLQRMYVACNRPISVSWTSARLARAERELEGAAEVSANPKAAMLPRVECPSCIPDRRSNWSYHSEIFESATLLCKSGYSADGSVGKVLLKQIVMDLGPDSLSKAAASQTSAMNLLSPRWKTLTS